MPKRSPVPNGERCNHPACSALAERERPDMDVRGNFIDSQTDVFRDVEPHPGAIVGAFFCARHYMQIRRHGVVTPDTERRSPNRLQPDEPVPYDATPRRAPDVPNEPLPRLDPRADEPTPAPDARKAPDDVRDVIAGIVRDVVDGMDLAGTDTRVDDVLRRLHGVENRDVPFHTFEVVEPPNKRKTDAVGPFHKMFDIVMNALVQGIHVWAHGPSGCGKTHMSQQLAVAMDVPFQLQSRVTHESALTGWVQPHNGELLETPFYLWCVHGGVFAFDDCDKSDPQAIGWTNAAMSNGYAYFPGVGRVDLHPSCVALFLANSVGHGADNTYNVNAMSGEVRNRFAFLEIGYDNRLEMSLVAGDEDATQWCKNVQSIRKAFGKASIDGIVSTRDVLNGAKMHRAGWTEKQVMDAFVWRGLETSQQRKVNQHLKGDA